MAKLLKKSKSPGKLRSNAKTRPKPSGVDKTPGTSQWSPLVLAALYNVVEQHDLNPDMSLEEVQKMVFETKR